MKTRIGFLLPSFLIVLVLLIGVFSTACEFCDETPHLCEFVGSGTSPLTSSDQKKLDLEAEGTVVFYHGFGCSESNESGKENILNLAGSVQLPAYATKATVFLNGWHAKYLSGDNHVQGFLTTIEKIKQEGNVLRWVAAGVLSDDNFKDAYSWCYYYTVVAWNPSSLDLTVDHERTFCSFGGDPQLSNSFVADSVGTTALSSFSSFLYNPDFTVNNTVAILPRGFGFTWAPACEDDHHLLQVGYNLLQTQSYIQGGKKYWKDTKFEPMLPDNTGRVGSGFVSWETSAIYKDNSLRRNYKFGETVSGLTGKDVGVIQPPYAILPVEDAGNCIGASTPPTEDFVIENVPFDFAVPMLTGWDLHYGCEDEHVAEIGIWIDKWNYKKEPGAASGTLHYTLSSRLRDKGGEGHYRTHKVTVLGLRRASGITPFEEVPDLVPFSPLGTSPDAFCRFENNGAQLRVTVRNQGNKNAPASKTTVLFPNFSRMLDTPPIPAGGSVDLVFFGTAACSFDCQFRITVDSANQVNESNNEGNNSTTGQCIG